MKKINSLLVAMGISIATLGQGTTTSNQKSVPVKTSTPGSIADHSQLIKAANEFMKLYNTGDTIAYRNLIVSIEPDTIKQKQLFNGYKNAFHFIGPVAIRKVEPVSSNNALVWVQDKQFDSWWRFNITTDSLQHFKNRTIMPVGFTSDFIKEGKLTDRQIAIEVDDYIKSKLKDKFKGNVFIEHGNKVIYSASFGTDPNGKENTSSQLFGLASMGKMFTSVSILQLRDKGMLSLEDRVDKYLPLKRKDIGAITIRQLLTHTSGMGDFFESPLYNQVKDSIKTAADWLPIIEEDKLRFEPGTGWAYSNTGFTVLGIIIEKVSGSSFEEYVQRNVFDVAGMKTTKVGSSAGGGEATIADLQSFSSALIDKKLLSSTTTKELFTYTVNEGKYGLGSEHQVLGDDYVFGHSGGFMNVCTELNLYLKSGYKVIILSNVDPPYGHFLSNKIKELIVRK